MTRESNYYDLSVSEEARMHVVEHVIDKLGFGWYQTRVIVILGFIQSTDTMETLIQAILGPSLRCDWKINSDLVAFLATMVFFGVCLGAAPMGYLSDRFGRRKVSLLNCVALIYFTFLCSFSPSYGWIAYARFISGIFISGLLTSSTSLISELMPEAYQSTGQLLVYSFDTIIAIYITGIGLGCLRANLSWRYFLGFSTAPLIISLLGLSLFLHESPVLLASWGRTMEAAEILDSIAKSNRRIPLTKTGEEFSFVGRLSPTELHRGIEFSISGITQLTKYVKENYKLSGTLLIFINFVWGFIIYGGATLLPVELPNTPRTCLQNPVQNNNLTNSISNNTRSHANADCCLPLGEEGYRSLFAAVIGSVMSFPVAFVLIWALGRKWTVFTCFAVASFLFVILSFCIPGTASMILFFLIRAVVSAGYNATNIYITELFAANIRSLAYGVTSTAYRIGVLTAPYVAQVYLHEHSVLGTVLIMSGVALIGTGLSAFLPHIGDQGNKVSKVIVDEPPSSTEETTVNRQKEIITKIRSTPFRNIFKPRKPLTAEEASAVASGENHTTEMSIFSTNNGDLNQLTHRQPNV